MHPNLNSEILVLDDNGTNLGRMLYRDAKSLAVDRSLDLVQVNKDNDNDIVVFKIMDHGKHKYEKKKNKQKHIASPLKEMNFKVRIDTHDLHIKTNQIKKFLLKGSDVKITVVMRGRERMSPQIAHNKLAEILTELGDSVQVQQKKSTKSTVFITVRPVVRKKEGKTGESYVDRSEENPGRVVESESERTNGKSESGFGRPVLLPESSPESESERTNGNIDKTVTEEKIQV